MSISYGSYKNDDLWLKVGEKQYIVDVEASCSYWYQPAKMYLSNGDPGYPEEWEFEVTDVEAEWYSEDMNKVEPTKEMEEALDQYLDEMDMDNWDWDWD